MTLLKIENYKVLNFELELALCDLNKSTWYFIHFFVECVNKGLLGISGEPYRPISVTKF